jgi:hypothetical protein
MSIITSTIAMAIATTITIVSTTAAITAAKISDIYPAKPAIRSIIASIYDRRCIYYCRRWIICNSRRIIDCWRRRINCRGWILG